MSGAMSPPGDETVDRAADEPAAIAWPSSSGWATGAWFGWRPWVLVLAVAVVFLTGFGLARWLPDDGQRAAYVRQQAEREGSASAQGAPPRGMSKLGSGFWLLCAPALLLVLMTGAVALARLQAGDRLDLVAGIGQGGNLLLQAAGTPAATGWPAALAAWGVAAGVGPAIASGLLPAAWWWLRLVMLGFGGAALLLIARLQLTDKQPVARLVRRLPAPALLAGAAVTVAVGLLPPAWARPGPFVWPAMGGRC